MKLWAAVSGAVERPEIIRRHELVIGPLCNSSFFGRKARLYYCNRCKWGFLVCGSKIAVLDDGNRPFSGNRSPTRFSADEKSCPVLEVFALEALREASTARATSPCR
jgi:hypothetical protein